MVPLDGDFKTLDGFEHIFNICRGKFTVKLINLTFQCPSLKIVLKLEFNFLFFFIKRGL